MRKRGCPRRGSGDAHEGQYAKVVPLVSALAAQCVAFKIAPAALVLTSFKMLSPEFYPTSSKSIKLNLYFLGSVTTILFTFPSISKEYCRNFELFSRLEVKINLATLDHFYCIDLISSYSFDFILLNLDAF